MSKEQEIALERKRKTCLRIVRRILGKDAWVRKIDDAGVSVWVAGAGESGGFVAAAVGLDSLEVRLRSWIGDVGRAREVAR
jgi:hypothetical protein